jgi:hypothetical protein
MDSKAFSIAVYKIFKLKEKRNLDYIKLASS